MEQQGTGARVQGSEKCGQIIDEAAALAELSGLSRNAKLWLMDRIGNRMNIIQNFSGMGVTAPVQKAVEGLIDDMKKIGLFDWYI